MHKLLNLGCGKIFSKDWVNLDFKSNSDYVQQYNLLNGIPFPDNIFDAVYHSHILEHFAKDDAIKFIQECFRVLKPGGIIRVVVPDLELIIKEYLQNLNKAWDDENYKIEYEWILLELFDQMIRFKGGGNMMEFIRNHKNNEYIISRLGECYYEYNLDKSTPVDTPFKNKLIYKLLDFFKTRTWLNKLNAELFKKELSELGLSWNDYKDRINLRKFRLNGEIHQWMYDRFSLKILLTENNFISFKIQNAFTSDIPEWEKYQLDTINGKIRKADSIFVEARK